MNTVGQRVLLWVGIVLAFLPLSALDSRKAVTQYIREVWDDEKGLPQNSVMTLCQTGDGRLWAGTQEGLVSFDGAHFRVYNKKNTAEITNNKIYTLCQSRDGRLWIGTGDGLLCRTADGRFHPFSFNRQLPSSLVRALLEDRAGRLWIGTGGGLGCLENGNLSVYTRRDGLAGDYIWKLLEDGQDRLWISTLDGRGVTVRDQGGFTVRLPQLGDGVLGLFQDRKGRLWFGTNNLGLFKLENDRLQPVGAPPVATPDPIRVIQEDRDGMIWYGSEKTGLIRLAGDRIDILDMARDSASRQINCILEDREGSLWIGTQTHGLTRLGESKVTMFGADEGLVQNHVLTVLESPSGDLWAGTYGGGLSRLHNGRVINYTRRDGLASDYILALTLDRRGRLWIGNDTGLQYWENDGFHSFRGAVDLSRSRVGAVLEDSRGVFWVGTDNGLYIIEGENVRFYRNSDGFAGSVIRCIVEDRDGAVWVGTNDAGVNVFRGGRIETIGRNQGLGSNLIMTVFPDRSGGVWIGTNGGGVSLWRNGEMRTLTFRDGLYDDTIHVVLEDRLGDLWFSTNRGVFRVTAEVMREFIAGRRQRLEYRLFNRTDGMRSSECNGGRQPSGWLCRDGRLCFAGMKGVVVIDPLEVRFNSAVPPVQVDRVVVDGREYAAGGEVRLQPGNEKLEFHYTALTYIAAERVHFKFLLQGYDREWIDAGTRRIAYYTRLPAGRYRFRVIACNGDGVWNRVGAELTCVVPRSFTQTVWFILLCTAALVFAGWGVIRWRVALLRAQRDRLSLQVAERTQELTALNEELRQANEVKTDLLYIAAHDLKNPLQGILGMAGILRNHYCREEGAVGKIELILKASRGMLQLIDELLESARIENGKLKLDRKPIDLEPLLRIVVYENEQAAIVKKQKITMELTEGCLVDGDRERLKEVFGNLVSNAVKFSPHESAISVSLAALDGEVRFSVQDRGPGLSETDCRRVFGKFQRLGPRPTGGENSTGLGLSIAKQLVEMHGGRIWVESTLGHGSTFHVALPLLAPGPAPSRPTTTADPVRGQAHS